MAASFALFSGLSRDSMVPAGSLAKASSVGASTVNGPVPFRVLTRSAAWTAATRVLNLPAPTAVSTRSFSAANAGVVREQANTRPRNLDIEQSPYHGVGTPVMGSDAWIASSHPLAVSL